MSRTNMAQGRIFCGRNQEDGMAKERQTLTRRTTEELYRRVVVEKTLAPGEKLPNEVELARELKVSRATLREALGALAAQGVLEVRRGLGTFVACWEDRDLSFVGLDQVRGKLRDLFELRAIFEPKVAALACRRATKEDMEEILRQGAEVERCIREGEDRSEADRAFHAAIVRAAHNEYMLRLLPVISQAVDTAIGDGGHREELAAMTLRDHALLLEFLERRDGEGAEHAMAIHLRHAMDAMGLKGGEE